MKVEGEVEDKSKFEVEVEEWWLDSCSGWTAEQVDKFHCSTSTLDFDSPTEFVGDEMSSGGVFVEHGGFDPP